MSKKHVQPGNRNTPSIAPKVPDPRRSSFSDETVAPPASQNLSDVPTISPVRSAISWLTLYVRLADAVTLLASLTAIGLAVFAMYRALPVLLSEAKAEAEAAAVKAMTDSPQPDVSSPSSMPGGIEQ